VSAAGLRAALKARTSAAHAALEATPLMRAMAGGAPTRAEYGDYLSRQHRLHAPLEAALEPWLPHDWRALRLVKARWLADDLAALGLAPARSLGSVPDVGDEGAAFGCLYVLEGATLGLQVLRKAMLPGHPARQGADRFMQGHGADSSALWRAFVDRLELLAPSHWPRATQAACATFDAFVGLYTEPCHRPELPR
jgi:heme oxygenase